MGAFGSKPEVVNKKPVPSISDIDRAVLDLKNARDRLQRYRRKLERDEAKLLEQAAAAKKVGNNTRALGVLRLRKYKLAELETCENQLLNILQMVETIDSKQNEKELLAALASGKDALKKMHEEHSVEDVLELMDQVAEEIAVENEINQILEEVPELSAEDEEAVLSELKEMEKEMMKEQGQKGEELPALPVAPTKKLPQSPEPVVPNKEAMPERQRVAVPG